MSEFSFICTMIVGGLISGAIFSFFGRAKGVRASTCIALSPIAAVIGNLVVMYILELIYIPRNMAPNGHPLALRAFAGTLLVSISVAIVSVLPGLVGGALMALMLRCCDRIRF